MVRTFFTRSAITEGLGENRHPGLEMAVADRRILRVPGDEEHLQLRTGIACGVGDLAAIHAPGEPDNVPPRAATVMSKIFDMPGMSALDYLM